MVPWRCDGQPIAPYLRQFRKAPTPAHRTLQLDGQPEEEGDTRRKGVYAEPGRTALLVVDCQPVFYAASPTIPHHFPQLPSNVARLLREARAAGVHVVHINAHYDDNVSPWLKWWSVLRDERVARGKRRDTPVRSRLPCTLRHDTALTGKWWIPQVVPGSSSWAAARGSEPVIVKHTVNGFFETRLQSELQARGITHVVVCGLVSSICVQGTASGSQVRGFATTVVPECCGDHTRTRHEQTMALYGNNMFALATIDELVRAWQS